MGSIVLERLNRVGRQLRPFFYSCPAQILCRAGRQQDESVKILRMLRRTQPERFFV